MSFNKLLATLSVVLLILTSTFSLHAQQGRLINHGEINDVADQLLCELPSINVAHAEIVQFLDNVFNQASAGGTNYDPPTPELVSSQLNEVSFQWESVPMASEYLVHNLDLQNGNIGLDLTDHDHITVNPLEGQYYLFAFISNGPDASFEKAIIIIEDKDLGYAENTSLLSCRCGPKQRDLSTQPPPICLPFTSNIYYAWDNTCPINKYTFTVTGNIGGLLINVDYWFLYDQTNPAYPKVYNFPECNPSIPVNNQIMDMGAIVEYSTNVLLHKDYIAFEHSLPNPLIQNLNVTARTCDCHQTLPIDASEGHGYIETSFLPEFKMVPNPFTDILYIHLDLPDTQKVEILITDITGKVWSRESKRMEKGQHRYQLPTNALYTGLYQVQLKTADHTFHQKVVKR